MGAITILSENDLLKKAALPLQKTKEVAWRGLKVTVKNCLPLQEYLALTDRILKDASDGNGNILYELLDFSLRVNIIATYLFVDLPKDAQKLYDIVYRTDLYDLVINSVDTDQVHQLLKAINLYAGIKE